eukprot:6922530-Pyramimonas_sp.AAC.1
MSASRLVWPGPRSHWMVSATWRQNRTAARAAAPTTAARARKGAAAMARTVMPARPAAEWEGGALAQAAGA